MISNSFLYTINENLKESLDFEKKITILIIICYL